MKNQRISPVGDALTEEIIGGGIEVHKFLGPGALESSYENCLAFELGLRGLKVQRQVYLPLRYKGFELDAGYRIDLIVEEKVIVELMKDGIRRLELRDGESRREP